ncbi:uncharacterized protein si:rp71-81e14.2 [Girardinichthys multiradiatus]|uniref:uncharacterized protein si:rp71-81e14.2 n=1 Tax=Girardinichthys multiradiatus TaxID=208333 RepID=UPI001FAE19BD|nr:uncharacterized protein si:rp71-81e14.2 [Girardinichthys multiradiatus]
MRKICSTCRRCSTMILLACFVLLLCLSAYSEGTVISQEPGGSINLTCSFDGCPSNISRYKYLYLYYEFYEQEEVLFLDNNSPSGMPRLKYEHRIQTHRSTLTFTISNLTVNDTGIYRCVRKKSADIAVNCSVYAVFITEKTSCSSIPPTIIIPPLMLYVIFICIISVLTMWIFFLLIIPRVKQWCIRRKARDAQTVSHDNVYEIMREKPRNPDQINSA